MKKKTERNVFIGIIVLLIAAPLAYYAYYMSTPGEYDQFAQCLADEGATFYGAFWCPHCQAQKALFGKSDDLLPYVECSLPDGRTQTAECREANIQGYPTWEFADGTRQSGEMSLAALSEKTGCPLPQ